MYFPDAADSVSIDIADDTVIEDEMMMMTCDASGGNPEYYTYQWWFTAKFGSEEKMVGDDAVLRVEQVEYTDAGQYRCEATNHGGSADSTQEVVVHCEHVVGISY